MNGFLGIGIFKIGSDTTNLISFANLNVDYIRDIDSFQNLSYRMEMDADGKVKELLRLKKTSDAENGGVCRSYCIDVTEYYLSRYEVSGVIIKNIRLRYYLNRLVQFDSDFSSNIEDALSIKYGKSEFHVETKKFNCMHNLTGISTPLEAKTYSNVWHNAQIAAYSVLYEKYDDHCQKETNSYFMYDVDSPVLAECESRGLDNALRPRINKSNLKDF